MLNPTVPALSHTALHSPLEIDKDAVMCHVLLVEFQENELVHDGRAHSTAKVRVSSRSKPAIGSVTRLPGAPTASNPRCLRSESPKELVSGGSATGDDRHAAIAPTTSW